MPQRVRVRVWAWRKGPDSVAGAMHVWHMIASLFKVPMMGRGQSCKGPSWGIDAVDINIVILITLESNGDCALKPQGIKPMIPIQRYDGFIP